MKQLLLGLCIGAILGGGLVKVVSEPQPVGGAQPSTHEVGPVVAVAGAASTAAATPLPQHAPKQPPDATTPSPSLTPSPTQSSAVPSLVVTPSLVLSAEHFKMVAPKTKANRPPTIEELHHKIATEPRDDAWALEVQTHWRNFLAQHAPSPDFDIVSVECRRTLCELAAFGNAPGTDKRWDQALQMARQEAWAQQFTNTNTHMNEQNGRAVILTILERRLP